MNRGTNIPYRHRCLYLDTACAFEFRLAAAGSYEVEDSRQAATRTLILRREG